MTGNRQYAKSTSSTHLGHRGICPMSGQPGPDLRLDQPLAHRVEDGLRAIVNLQLLVHVADVVANGLLADVQPPGDLLVGQARSKQFEDLDLARMLETMASGCESLRT